MMMHENQEAGMLQAMLMAVGSKKKEIKNCQK